MTMQRNKTLWLYTGLSVALHLVIFMVWPDALSRTALPQSTQQIQISLTARSTADSASVAKDADTLRQTGDQVNNDARTEPALPEIPVNYPVTVPASNDRISATNNPDSNSQVTVSNQKTNDPANFTDLKPSRPVQHDSGNVNPQSSTDRNSARQEDNGINSINIQDANTNTSNNDDKFSNIATNSQQNDGKNTVITKPDLQESPEDGQNQNNQIATPSAPAHTGTSDQKTDAEDWLSNELAGLIQYPSLARQNGWQEVQLVQLNVNRRGQIVSAELVSSSHYPLLQKTTEKALKQLMKKIAPIPLNEELNLEIEVSYRLDPAS